MAALTLAACSNNGSSPPASTTTTTSASSAVACTKSLITAAAKNSSSVGSVSAVNGFGCSGSWAYADVTVGSGAASFDAVIVLQARVELVGGRPGQRLQQPPCPQRHLRPGLHDQLTSAGQVRPKRSAALRRS